MTSRVAGGRPAGSSPAEGHSEHMETAGQRGLRFAGALGGPRLALGGPSLPIWTLAHNVESRRR